MLNYDCTLLALKNAGLSHPDSIEILNTAQELSNEKLSVNFRLVVNDLYYSAMQLKFTPDSSMLFSEAEACLILGISKSSFSVARATGKATPEAVKCGATYRYSIHNLADWKIKKDNAIYKKMKS